MIMREKITANTGFMAWAGFMILIYGACNAQIHAATVLQKEDMTKEAVSIDVQEKAQVAEEMVCLRDIAIIQADEEMKSRIETIKISPSPKPGNSGVISGGRVISVVRSMKWLPENTQIAVPDSVLIERQFQLIPEERLEEYFNDHIAKTIGNSRYGLSQFKVRGTGKYPVGSLSLETVDHMTRSPNEKRVTGRMSLNVAVKINGSEEGRVSLSGWVERYEKIVVVKRPVPRDTVLIDADVDLEETKITTPPSQFFLSVDDAIGKRATRNIRPGTCLSQNMLEMPPMIQKGDRVKIMAKNGLLTVIASGVAEGSGVKGEQIEVRNINSDKPVVGVVRDASVVEVLF